MHRSLLFLVGVTFPYLFIGSVLGALDHPINLIKARQMLTVFGGPFVGLLVVTWLRSTVQSKLRWVAPVLTILALTILCDHFSNYAKSGMVKTARSAYAPAWGTDASEMKERAGSVFLCGHETFPSFFPVYTFLAANEHYSHPASQFKKRYDLLDWLEKIDDSRVINIALRNNRFDKVDFFMPHRDGLAFDITISLSNYPNKYYTRVFKFPDTLVTDTSLFRRLKGDDLFEVLTPVEVPLAQARHTFAPGTDTLVQFMRLAMIRDQFTPEGQTELDVHTQADWSRWRRPPEVAEATVFGDSVQLKDFRFVSDGDSLHVLIAFEALESLSRQFRVMVHLFVDDQMSNFDFSPVPATNTWQRYETVLCRRTIPNPSRPFRLYIGMFDRTGSLPGVVQLDSDPED
jgi:hypothetical protein